MKKINIEKFRRYRVGEHEEYDRLFDYKVKQSHILYPPSLPTPDSIAINDKNDIQNLIREQESVILPARKKAIKDIEQQFKDDQQRRINEGKRPQKEMPRDMFKEKLIAEVQYDIGLIETDYLENLLNGFLTKEKQVHKKCMDNMRLNGSSSLKGGIIDEMDGQNVSVINGKTVIDDVFSKYDGMHTADYLEHVVKAAKKNFKPNRPIKRENLPDWPEGVKNFKAKKKQPQ